MNRVYILLLCFGFFAVTTGFFVKRPRISHRCFAPSLVYGGQASCGGIIGKRCPNPTDKCLYSLGSTLGKCCLGCGNGYPYRRIRCGGWAGKPCPWGYYCNTSTKIADSKGICCRNKYRYG